MPTKISILKNMNSINSGVDFRQLFLILSRPSHHCLAYWCYQTKATWRNFLLKTSERKSKIVFSRLFYLSKKFTTLNSLTKTPSITKESISKSYSYKIPPQQKTHPQFLESGVYSVFIVVVSVLSRIINKRELL